MIEKLRVGRALTQSAKVAWRSDEAATEVSFPHSVDQHPGSHRGLRARDRTRQLEPSASLSECHEVGWLRENLEEPSRHLGTEGCGVAAQVHLHLGDRLALVQAVNER